MHSPADPTDLHALLAHERPLRALCRALVEGAGDGDDLAQETWLAALQRPPERAPRAWLRRVARNLAARHQRNAARRARREAGVAQPEALPDSAKLVQRAELFQALLAEVVTLEEPYRRAVMLRYLEGRSTPEIAAALAITEANVHVRLHRGLRELRTRLDRRGGRERWLGAFAVLGGAEQSAGASLGVWLTMSNLQAKGWLFAALALLLVGLFLGFAWLLAPSLTKELEGAILAESRDGAMAAPVDDEERTLSTQRRAAFEPALDPGTGLPIVPATLRVRVVDAATRREVPHAQIFFLDEKRHLPLSLSWHFGAQGSARDGLVRLHGEVSNADERGTAELPRPERRAYVGAEGDTRWGMLEVHPGIEEPVVIALEPYREVEVEVLDALGAPVADVPVALMTPQGVFYQRRGSHLGIASSRTRANGRATLRFQASALHSSLRPIELIAGCDVLGIERSGVRFDIEAAPSSPIRLELPDTGVVIVDVEDDQGRPLRDALLLGCDYALQQPRREGPTLASGRAQVAQEGRVVFESVGLDLDLEIGCWSESAWSIPPVSITGPRHAGEVVRATMRASGRHPLLRGRVVDPRGRPLRKTELQSVLRMGDKDWSMFQPLTLDADGRFALPLTWGRGEREALVLELIRWDRYDGNRMPSGPLATREIPEDLKSAGGELGDLVLREPELCFAGRVVDDAGSPVSRAEIRIAILEARASGEPERSSTPLFAISDAAGRFTCRGELADTSAELHVSAAGHGFAVFGPRRPGELDLELVLPRSGEIRGRLLLDDGVRGDEIWITTEPSPHGRITQTQPSSDGSFSLQDVSPGLREVAITWHHRFELERVSGIEVRSARAASDPRLLTIDLRGRMAALELQILEARGVALEELALVAERSGASPVRIPLLPDEERCISVLVPRAAETIRVEARSCVPVTLASREGRQRVELRRGPSVRLATPAPLPPVGVGGTLLFGTLHLDEPDADDAWRRACERLDSVELDARGAALLDLPRAGRYRIEWDGIGGHVTHFEVSDSAEVQLVRFALPWEKRETDRD
ncbi:MAG: sigma-70 family RNA polymerase sigma factor [Planctomycetes bacterium]|nr:sigma-70 family RNA polymerase sigma factor [Planctomycetota bacterium]